MIIGLGVAGILAFALLTIKDLIKYLIKKARSKKNSVAGPGKEAGQLSFPQVLKRNLIILPIGCVILGMLAFVLNQIFPAP